MVLSIVNGDIPPLSEVVPNCPLELQELVARTLSLEPRKRPGTAAELRVQLAAIAAGAFRMTDSVEVAAYIERVLGSGLAPQSVEVSGERPRQPLTPTRIDPPGRLLTPTRVEPGLAAPPPELALAAPRATGLASQMRVGMVALAGIAIGVGLTVLLMRGVPSQPADGDSTPGAPTALPPTAELEPLPTAATSSGEPASAPQRELEVRSNRRLARVRIDDVEHAVDPPSLRASVPVSSDARKLTVFAEAGGERSVDLRPNQRSAIVRFGGASAVRPPSGKKDPLGSYNPYADGG